MSRPPSHLFLEFALKTVENAYKGGVSNVLLAEYNLLNSEFRNQVLSNIADIQDLELSAQPHQKAWKKKHNFHKDLGDKLSVWGARKCRLELQAIANELYENADSCMKKLAAFDGIYATHLERLKRDRHVPDPSHFLEALDARFNECSEDRDKWYNRREGLQQEIAALNQEMANRMKTEQWPSVEQWEAAETWAKQHTLQMPVAVKPNALPPQSIRWESIDFVGEDLGMTTLELKLGLDSNCNIINRVVKKCVELADEDWHSICKFHQDVHGAYIPLEWYIQTLVGGQPDSNFSLKTIARPVREARMEEDFRWGIQRTIRQYKMYMEFAPHGNLKGLYEKHATRGELVPKAFIWLVLEALCQTALIMSRGAVFGNVDKWPQIVHRDLKPENIFLGSPTADHWPQYPTPLVSDYGLAFLTSPEDKANPLLWGGAGTKGFQPPEQLRFVDGRTGKAVDDFKMLSPCNVWGIGAIVIALIQRGPPLQPNYLDGPYDACEYALNASWHQHYGKEFCEKINECLRFDPIARPSIVDLMNWVYHNLHDDAELWAAYQGDGAAPVRPMTLPSEAYKIGMAWSQGA